MSGSTQGKLRRLVQADVQAALQLSMQAGWNQTADDWSMLLQLAPHSCLAIEVENELAATTTLLSYGMRLAWIGMVLTKKEFHGRGFARRLLSEALKLADQMKIETVKLDATEQGKPLYEKSGFRSEQPVERWSLNRIGCDVHSPNVASTTWNDSDPEAFGADRSSLLNCLAERNPPWSVPKAFLLGREGVNTAYLGPCVSDSPQTARMLIERFMQMNKSSVSWDVLSQNGEAVAIAKDLGFAPQRHLTRMVRGKDLRAKENSVYALAGFEFG